MTLSVTVQISHTTPNPRHFWVVAGDEDVIDWHYQSRTLDDVFQQTYPIRQAPAVYGYSPEPVQRPNDYRVDETPLRLSYYALNSYDTSGAWDGLGQARCDNFLFKDDTALYNGKGFPGRELLTMSQNILQEIEWVTERGYRYLKFKTLRLDNSVGGMSYATHPQFVHRFNLVQWGGERTEYVPKVSRGGYLYYYLISRDGYGYMPERYIKAV
jgi:hypothetical protein